MKVLAQRLCRVPLRLMGTVSMPGRVAGCSHSKQTDAAVPRFRLRLHKDPRLGVMLPAALTPASSVASASRRLHKVQQLSEHLGCKGVPGQQHERQRRRMLLPEAPQVLAGMLGPPGRRHHPALSQRERQGRRQRFPKATPSSCRK